MKPVVKTVTGVADSDWIKLDHRANPFNIGFGCVMSATATYTVQHTFDDVDSGSVTAFDHDVVAAKTVNEDGNYAFPVRAIRLHVTASTGTVTITSIQAGEKG